MIARASGSDAERGESVAELASKLTERQEITPYKWVNPDEER